MRRLLVLIALLVANFASAQVSTVPPGSTSAVFTGGTITTPILGVPGDCVTVPYSFTGATTTGFSRASLTDAAVVCVGGAEIFRVNALGPIAQLRLQIIAGTAAAPGVVFTGGTTTGLYHVSPGIGFSVVGASVGTWTATALTSTAPFLAPAGTGAAPGMSFSAESSLGIFRSGAGLLGFASGGFEIMRMSAASFFVTAETRLGSANQFTWSSNAVAQNAAADTGLARSAAGVVKVTDGGAGNGSIRVADGTRALPGLSFVSEPDSGLYVLSAGAVGFSVNDTVAFSFAPLAAGLSLYVGNTEAMRISSVNGLNQDSDLVTQMVTSGATLGSPDTGLARVSAGVVKVTDGGAGSGSIRVAAGTAGAPSLSFVGDPDTGIFQVATGRMAIGLDGAGHVVADTTNALRLGSARNMGWSADVNPDNAFSDTLMVRDAVARVRASGSSSALGYYLSGIPVEVNATTKAATIIESGELYTNTGDADGSIINLPDDPTIGTQFRVALTVAQTVTINAAAGESIQDAGTNAASRAASAIGDTIHLIAVTGGSGAVWMVVSKTGTWS